MEQKDKERIQKIKAWRKKLGMTQMQFAAHIGITYGTIRAWEINQTKPQSGVMGLIDFRLKYGEWTALIDEESIPEYNKEVLCINKGGHFFIGMLLRQYGVRQFVNLETWEPEELPNFWMYFQSEITDQMNEQYMEVFSDAKVRKFRKEFERNGTA